MKTRRRQSAVDLSPTLTNFRNALRGSKWPVSTYDRLRADLSLCDIPAAVRWLRTTPFRGGHSNREFPASLTQLLCSRPPSYLGLSGEFRWAVGTSVAFSSELIQFLELSRQFESYLLSSKYPAATMVLDQIESSLGYSLWSIKARLVLLSLGGGFDAQKQYAGSIINMRNVDRFVTFITYYVSIRNEEAMSLASFRSTYEGHLAARVNDFETAGIGI